MPRLHRDPRYGTYHVIWTEDRKQRQKALKTKDEEKARTRFKNFERDLMAGKVAPIAQGIRIRLFAFVEEFIEFVAAEPDKSRETERLYTDSLAKAKEC